MESEGFQIIIEINDDATENNEAGNHRINNKTAKSTSFEYNAKIIGGTPSDDGRLDTEAIFPRKYLSNFWGSLDLLLINCKIELNLPWSTN